MMWDLPAGDTYFAKLLTDRGFEIDHLDEALKYCKNFRVAVDGGAHIGTWTAYMADKFDRVVAFEPAPDTVKCLTNNIKARGLGNVVIWRVALGDNEGWCSIIDDPSRIGNTGARIAFVYKNGGDTQLRTLDGFEFPILDFLKLDLEGSEIRALKGATKTIERCKPTIMVECKEFNPIRFGGVRVVKDYLNAIGYQEVGGIRNDRVYVPK